MPVEIAQFTPHTYTGSLPIARINPRTGKMEIRVNNGFPLLMTERGLMVNSLLRTAEWRLLETEVQMAAGIRLTAVAQLQSRGLVRPVSSLGTLVTEWGRVGEMTQADISMTGQANGEVDRLEYDITGVPIPIVFKEFRIPKRQLEAARLAGNALDTTHAAAASRVVAEKLEDMLINGDSTVFDSRHIYGYTNEPNRNQVVAAGDWGTISNILPTVSAAIAALVAEHYYGPYTLYLDTNQYTEATTSFYSDGSGESAYDRILRIPQITAVLPVDSLDDGEGVLAQLTSDVVDWAQHMDITLVEWLSGDGMMGFFKVMAVAAPRIKSDKSSQSGVAHITGM